MEAAAFSMAVIAATAPVWVVGQTLYQAVGKKIAGPETRAKMEGHSNCTHADPVRSGWNYTSRYLFACLSENGYWSWIVGCEKRCPGTFIEYRLEQDGAKVTCQRRELGRTPEMLVGIAMHNLIELWPIGPKEDIKRSSTSVGNRKYPDLDLYWRYRYTELECLERKQQLSPGLSKVWLWESLQQAKDKYCLRFKKDNYTIPMMESLVDPVAHHFAKIVQLDDDDLTVASEARRNRLDLNTSFLPVYKVGEVEQKQRRLAPRPLVSLEEFNSPSMQKKLHLLEEISLTGDWPKDADFDDKWCLDWHDVDVGTYAYRFKMKKLIGARVSGSKIDINGRVVGGWLIRGKVHPIASVLTGGKLVGVRGVVRRP